MNSLDRQYLDLLSKIMEKGRKKEDRTGTGTLSVFDHTIDHNMAEGFPLLTTKEVWFKGVLHELLWFLRGDTNIQYLVRNGVNIWSDWPYSAYAKKGDNLPIKYMKNIAGTGEAKNLDDSHRPYTMAEFVERIKTDDDFAAKFGDVGKVYGAQWLKWTNAERRGYSHVVLKELNQLDVMIDTLKKNPDSRRIMVTAWNPAEQENVALPPCHYFFQVYSEVMTPEERMEAFERHANNYDKLVSLNDMDNFPTRRLSIKWNIRSCDIFLGGPFDIASYGLLLTMLAHVTNHVPHRCIMSNGDAHIYLNHLEQVKQQLGNHGHGLPRLKINTSVESIYDFKYEDFELVNYANDGKIGAPINV